MQGLRPVETEGRGRREGGEVRWGGGQQRAGRTRGGGPPGDLPAAPSPRPQAQLSEQELHYASLLPVPCSERPYLSRKEGANEDPSTDYACIAKN